MPFGKHSVADSGVENSAALNPGRYKVPQAVPYTRFIPETPDIYKEAAAKNKLWIFNVGPWPHVRMLGSAGRWSVKPCPDGKPYSEPIELLGVMEEPGGYPISENECKPISETGYSLAMQIIGEGPFIPRSSSLVPFGVFISDSNPPKEADVKAARENLQMKYTQLVKEANDAASIGPAALKDILLPDWHIKAARALNKSVAECPWLQGSTVEAARENCPACGEVYTKGIMKCRCGFLLDKAKYDKAVKDGLFAT